MCNGLSSTCTYVVGCQVRTCVVLVKYVHVQWVVKYMHIRSWLSSTYMCSSTCVVGYQVCTFGCQVHVVGCQVHVVGCQVGTMVMVVAFTRPLEIHFHVSTGNEAQ